MKNLTIAKIALALFTALIFSSAISSAQSSGTNQIGLRLGGYTGITFRHINGNDVGIQADWLFRDDAHGSIVSVMAEKHFPLKQQFVFYVGGGGFIGAWHDPNYEKGTDGYWNPRLGIQGVVGFDYYFTGVPLQLGLDVTPRFNFFDDPFPWDAGLSLRYIF